MPRYIAVPHQIFRIRFGAAAQSAGLISLKEIEDVRRRATTRFAL
jgi:hypothetical protein